MKKIVILSLAAVLASACSDSPAGPTLNDEAIDPLFFASHGSILAPSITSASATGDDVTIEWTWSDPEDDWDLVSFTVLRDDEELEPEVDNARPYTAGVTLSRSFTDEGLEDGTYEYCVEVMAKLDGAPALTHHNRSCAEVTVGGVVYTVEILSVNGRGGDFDNDAGTITFKKRGDFTFFAALLANGVEVECTVPSADVDATATFASPASVAGDVSSAGATGCDFHGASGRYRYEFTLSNLANNEESSGDIAFEVDGQAADNDFTFTTN